MSIWQWTERYNCAVRTGCETCAAALVLSADDPAVMAQAFAERGPPSPEPEDD